MTIALAQFLRFHDADSTYARWQARWPDTVTHDGAQWRWVRFESGGLIAGGAQEESQFTINAPATTTVLQTIERALDRGWLATLELWVGDPVAAATGPDPNQILLCSYTGQVTGGQDSLTLATVQLGSILAPIGRSVPPRQFSVGIMGVGAVLR